MDRFRRRLRPHRRQVGLEEAHNTWVGEIMSIMPTKWVCGELMAGGMDLSHRVAVIQRSEDGIALTVHSTTLRAKKVHCQRNF